MHTRIQTTQGESVVALWRVRGRCVGVRTNRRAIRARATLLATGGYSALWQRTTNPAGSVGEGITLAYKAGAAVADLELTQFQPTTLAGNGLLLPETLRIEGARLLDDSGNQFVNELAPRDVVTRAIQAQGSALLDLRPIDRTQFPKLIGLLERNGYRPSTQPVPVAPAAHYTLGGIVTNLAGQTEVPSLYAVGECACTGVHGINRLTSNSISECLVFGRRAALHALDEPPLPKWLTPPSVPAGYTTVTPQVRTAFWTHAGVSRDRAGLEQLLAVPHPLARLIAQSALSRAESRGCHYRTDHPQENPALTGHLVLRSNAEPTLERWA